MRAPTWTNWKRACLAALAVPACAFAAPGDPIGPETPVNEVTTGWQMTPSVAIDALGHFVVAWNDDFGVNGASRLAARDFTGDGSAGGERTLLEPNPARLPQRYPEIAMDDAGNHAVTWSMTRVEPNGARNDEVGFQRFSSLGVPQFPVPMVVNQHTTGAQWYPNVAMDADGDAVVVWVDYDAGAVVFQRFDAAANPVGGNVTIAASTNAAGQPDVAMTADGHFAVVWRGWIQGVSRNGLVFQRFAPDGTPLGAPVPVAQPINAVIQPVVAMDADGDAVVAWSGQYATGSAGTDVFLQRIDRNGAIAGGIERINTFTSGTQHEPAVAMDGTGRFVVAWESTGQGPSFRGIFGQRFRASGARDGGEFPVSSRTTGNQFRPGVAMDDDGNFVVAWDSFDQEGPLQNNGGYGIFMQRFEGYGGGAVNGSITLHRTLADLEAAGGPTSPRLDFDAINPGDDISGRSFAGIAFDRPGNALNVVRATDTFTPGEPGRSLTATSGDRLLSPGGVSLDPTGPASEDSFTMRLATPVQAIGFDLLFQSRDCCTFTTVTLFDARDRRLGRIALPADGQSWGIPADAAGASFYGFSSASANIARLRFDEIDSNGVNPDSNIGLDTVVASGPTLPVLHVTDVQRVEGNAGIPMLRFSIIAVPAPDPARPVSFDFETVDGTAVQAADFRRKRGTEQLTFGLPSTTIEIPLIPDTVPEADESFTLRIGSLVNALPPDHVPRGTIVDDDPVHARVVDRTVTEDDAPTQRFGVSIVLDEPATTHIRLRWQTFDGTARANFDDYRPSRGFVDFMPGTSFSQLVHVPVTIHGDDDPELDESLFVRITSVVEGRVEVVDGEGEVFIHDDD